MSGAYGSPYRVPCGAVSWPAQEWFLGGFWQHKKDSESSIGKLANSTTVPDWECDPLTGSPYSRNVEPYPRRFTDSGLCPPDACTGAVCTVPCAPWSQLNAPASGSYDHNSYTADAAHPIDFSKCRKIGFKNVQAARVWHGCFGWTDGACPIPQTGCGCESVTLERATYPQTKYLTKDAQCTLNCDYTYRYAGQLLGCQYEMTGSVDGHYHRGYSVASNTGLITEGTCEDSYVATYHNACVPPDTFSGVWAPQGSILTWSDTALKDATKITASCGRISVPADTHFDGLDGMTAAEVEAYYAGLSSSSSGSDTHWSWVKNTTISAVASVTNTLISIVISERIVEVWTDLDPPNEVLTIDMTNTVTIAVTLGGANDFADVQTDCLTLLDQWNLTDDIKYPWRIDDYCSIAPLVTRREVRGPVSPDIWAECGYVDPNSTDTSLLDPYDGSIKGAPLGQGFGHHFDFGHITWKQCVDGSSQYVPYRATQGAWAGGHDPLDGTGEATDTGIPIGATQWTDNYYASLDWLPAPGLMPAGAWVYNHAGAVVAQKWAETRVPRPSMNFARPCGPDRDRLDETTVRCIHGVVGSTVEIESATAIVTGDTVYLCSASPLADGFYTVSKTDDTHYVCTAKANWPGTSTEIENCGSGIMGKVRYPTAPGLCGRVQITSCVQDGANVIVTLSTPAPQLRVGDLVDFTSVPGLGSSVAITVATSSTVFKVVGTLTTSPTLLGYLACHGAASYEWDDTLWKGDYLWATWSHNYRDYQERDRVIQVAIDCAGCPDVPTPGAAIRTAQVDYLPRSVDGLTYGQGCAPWTVCRPFVLCFSSSASDDFGEYGDTIALGSTTGDDEYGDLWQGAFIQHVGDPFWQEPHAPCEGDPPSPRVAWSMDSGDCTGDYPQIPWVEARDGSPTGAPAFPTGISFHVLTLAEIQSGTPPDGIVLAPPAGVGYVAGSSPYQPRKTSTPWGIYLAEEVCVCSAGTFATTYEQNGVSCPT